jgi:hypothetical protein
MPMCSHFPDTSAAGAGRRDGVLARGGPEEGAEGLAGRALFGATAVPGTPPGNAESRGTCGSGTGAVGDRRPAAGPGAHPATLHVPGRAAGESSCGHLDRDGTHAGDGFPGASGPFGVSGGGDRCERPNGEPGALPDLVKHFCSLCGPQVPMRAEEGFQGPWRGAAGLPAGQVWQPGGHPGRRPGSKARLVACPRVGGRWGRHQRSGGRQTAGFRGGRCGR